MVKESFWKRLGKRLSFADTDPYAASRPGQTSGTPPDQQEVQRLILKTTEAGVSGTRIYSGYIEEEYLTNLQNTDRADIFDQMDRSDPQISMCLSAVKNPILSSSKDVEPAGDLPEQKIHAEFIKHLLFNDMDQTFDAFVEEALTMLKYGYALFEMTDKVVLGSAAFGNYNGIKQLGWRSPRTIQRFNIDPPSGKLMTITQYAYGDQQRMVDIPAEYAVLMTINKEGANYEGVSLLRKCYGCWFRKDHYLKMNAIGIEKFAIPTPVVEFPSAQQNSQQYDAMIDALEAYTTHQANYLAKPSGWTVTLNTSVYDPEKVEKSIDAEDRRMVKVFLANFLELGMGGAGGAYALSNDLSDFFLSGIIQIGNVITSAINKQVIPRYIKMNYGPQPAYPVLKFSGIDDKAGQEFGNLLKALSESKWLTPSDQDEENLRKRLGLQKMSLIGQRHADPPKPMFSEKPSLLERIRLADKRRVGENG